MLVNEYDAVCNSLGEDFANHDYDGLGREARDLRIVERVMNNRFEFLKVEQVGYNKAKVEHNKAIMHLIQRAEQPSPDFYRAMVKLFI